MRDLLLIVVFALVGMLFAGAAIGYLLGKSENQEKLDNYYRHDCRQMISCAYPGDVHAGRIWEDGSYRFEYRDGTSEEGCYGGGLCND